MANWHVEVVTLDGLATKLGALESSGWEIREVAVIGVKSYMPAAQRGLGESSLAEAERKAEAEGMGPTLLGHNTSVAVIARKPS